MCCSFFELGPRSYDSTRLQASISCCSRLHADFRTQLRRRLCQCKSTCPRQQELVPQGSQIFWRLPRFVPIAARHQGAIRCPHMGPPRRRNAIDPASWPSTLSAPLLDFLRSRTLQRAKRTFIGWRTWSPCSSLPTCPLLPLPLRPLRRLLRVAASTLRARRPLSKPRRIRPQGPPLCSQPRRSSTSPERSAG